MFIWDPKITHDLKKGLPSWVKDVRFRETVDANGESALVVFLIIEAKSKAIEDPAILSQARDVVSAVFDKHAVSSWPYVRFVSEPDATLETR
jgi:hypothetical protein